MNSQEKEITYKSTNSYSTLNALSGSTKNIWFVCHGMGYLSRYFLRYFKDLPANENYIIAPQAPSKYYIQPKMHVGANWLTRDKTESGMETIISYFDAIFEAEQIPKNLNLIVLGYSQGVSVALRYLAIRRLHCNQIVIHSGGIPKELTKEDFKYLPKETQVKLIYGTEDEYLNEKRIRDEENRAKDLFSERLKIMPFNGNHSVNVEIVMNLVP